MDRHSFELAGVELFALPSGAMWWPDQALLCISDMHLGKSGRLARRDGLVLPPYDTRETLTRLSGDLATTGARTVICLGDSFDDLAAAQSLSEEDRLRLTSLQAGRDWIWIEGNHDPGPVNLDGRNLAELKLAPLTFRHIARVGATGEVSGHYHPKVRISARGRTVSRPAFLLDHTRVILPAYGTFTGGLRSDHATLASLMQPQAVAILTGPQLCAVPMPR